MEIKAIETEYNGYRFRSRLEARWAVFFDAAKIKYEYEPEGFEFADGTRYLPDFYLPDEDMYVEVKAPRNNLFPEIKKIGDFIKASKKVVLLLSNIPDQTHNEWFFSILYLNPVSLLVEHRYCPFYVEYDDEWKPLKMKIDREYAEPVSLPEMTIRFLFDSKLYNIESTIAHRQNRIIKLLLPAFYDDETMEPSAEEFMKNCFKKARQARFEHGEKP